MRKQVSLSCPQQYRLIWVRSMKEAVDETCKVDPIGFINASNIETAKELKDFIESF